MNETAIFTQVGENEGGGEVIPLDKVASPFFTPTEGMYMEAQSVSITTETPGAIIHYTVDGSLPTALSPEYLQPLTIPFTTCLRALASKPGMLDSEVVSTTYTICEWQCVTLNAAFAGRDGAGALVFQDRMWLLGGWNPSDRLHFPQVCNSEVWSSVEGGEWILEAEAPWEGRHTAGYVVHAGKMWIVGGDPIQGHYQNDVWNSDDGVNWNRVTDAVPWGPRVLHYTVAHQGKIWVMGGQTLPQFAPAEEVFYGDVWCSEDGANWAKVADNCPWAPRGLIGGAAVHKGRIWILGGGTYDTPSYPDRLYYNDVWSSADGVQWENVLESAPWEPREYHNVAVWDGKLWVLAGYAGKNLSDVWYSADGVDWREISDIPWAPRHAASIFVYQDALWVVAGNNMFPDVWKLVKVYAQ